MVKGLKRIIYFLTSIVVGVTLVGCQGGSLSNNDSVSIEEIVVDEITEGSYTGCLEDVVILNKFLGDNSRYEFTYNAPNGDTNLQVKSSRENVLTIEKTNSATNSYAMVTHVPGDTVLTIYDSEDYLFFRKVIRVRKAFSPETIKEQAYENDIYTGFVGFGGSYRLTCIEDESSFRWQLTGKDEVETGGMNIVFDCTYLSYYEPWDMYVFQTTMVSEHDGNKTDILFLYISRTADLLNLYYDAGGGQEALLNVFSPLIYSNIRPGFSK